MSDIIFIQKRAQAWFSKHILELVSSSILIIFVMAMFTSMTNFNDDPTTELEIFKNRLESISPGESISSSFQLKEEATFLIIMNKEEIIRFNLGEESFEIDSNQFCSRESCICMIKSTTEDEEYNTPDEIYCSHLDQKFKRKENFFKTFTFEESENPEVDRVIISKDIESATNPDSEDNFLVMVGDGEIVTNFFLYVRVDNDDSFVVCLEPQNCERQVLDTSEERREDTQTPR